MGGKLVFDFKRETVENRIGMRREDNPELFNSVYRQIFGTNYEDTNKRTFGFSDNDD